MNKNFRNPLFAKLAMKNAGRMKRFSGDAAPALVRAEGLTTAIETAPTNASTLNVGRRSALNVETPLHANAITLTITNKGTTADNAVSGQADLVLSAGRFDGRSDLAAQLIKDGVTSLVNDAGTAMDVEVSCEYGVDGTVDTWSEFLEWAKYDGLAISTTRLQWTQAAQMAKKLRFQRVDLFGDHVVDNIFPAVYYDPTNYDLKLIQSEVGFPLDSKTIVKYSLVPGESVIFTFWVSAINENDRVLRDFLARRGGNMLG